MMHENLKSMTVGPRHTIYIVQLHQGIKQFPFLVRSDREGGGRERGGRGGAEEGGREQ